MNCFAFFCLACGLGLAACAGEPAPPPAAENAATPLLAFDTTGRAVFATNRQTNARVQLFEDDRGETEGEGTWHQLLSSAGPYVSYRTDWYYDGGAHPSYGTRYAAVAVEDSLRAADLRELFSEEELLAALRRDSLVQAAGLGVADLDGLLAALGEAYPCRIYVGDFFSAFHVRAVEDGMAVVEIGLTHGCEVERGAFTLLTLRLPIAAEKQTLFGDLRVFAPEERPGSAGR